MYKIFADDILIYDSTLEDYKIGKGSISLETDKSGSFAFSVYPDHFFYNAFVKLKTVITVYKSGRIVFRGRILSDVTDYWNNKVITCEGELGFLQDSIIRPFTFTGTPENLFKKFIEEHNSQVDEFKRFKIGEVTVEDPNGYIARSNSGYETALSNMTSRLLEDATGGHFYITHGDDGRDPIPTIHYLAEFNNLSSQTIEFGSNLKNYTKTVKAETTATAIIPLGRTIDDGNSATVDPKLTIASVNGGVDYVYDADAVAAHGWIFKTVSWDDVTDAATLKKKAEAYLATAILQNITIELNAIDLHLLDRSIESFRVCDYVRVISAPHNFDATLLCNKQTLDLLKPENDSVVLGTTYASFTEQNSKVSSSISSLSGVRSTVDNVRQSVVMLNTLVEDSAKSSEEGLSKKILYNNSGDCILTAIDLSEITFSDGLSAVDLSAYIPENYSLVSCFIQLADSESIVVNSVSIAETTVSIRCCSIADGSAYSGTPTGVIRCLGICQKITEGEITGG